MEVTFVLKDERTFCVEVGFFDSFQEIKEKIEKYKGFPACSQTLLFNGQVLENEDVIFNTDINEESLLQLIVASVSGILVSPPTLSPPSSPNRNEFEDAADEPNHTGE